MEGDEADGARHLVLACCSEHLQQTQRAVHVTALRNPRTNSFAETEGAFDGCVSEQQRVLHVRPIHGFI